MLRPIHLDLSFTKVPDNTKTWNGHNSFWGLAELGYPEGRNQALGDSIKDKKAVLPDHRLMCFDHLYYASVWQPFEWEKEWSPAWRFVGRHFHFHPDVAKLAESYVRKAFHIAENAAIPKVRGNRSSLSFLTETGL